jgi:hypothetical protein
LFSVFFSSVFPVLSVDAVARDLASDWVLLGGLGGLLMSASDSPSLVLSCADCRALYLSARRQNYVLRTVLFGRRSCEPLMVHRRRVARLQRLRVARAQRALSQAADHMLLLGLSPLQCREVAEGLDLLETLSAAEFRVLRARQEAAATNAAAAAAIVRAFIAGDMARY